LAARIGEAAHMSGAYSLTEQLAKHLQRPVDAATRDRARLHLLDWVACVVGARGSAVAARFKSLPEDSAYRSWFLGNVLEMDDVHRAALLHPGPVIWQRLLYGRPDGMSAMLDAGVVGYEAMIAVGCTLDAFHYAHFHPTATAGAFGAAAAHAKCFWLDEYQMVMALGLAGSVAGGLWQTRHEGDMAKQWHAVHAMDVGSSAAHFATMGITGPRFILEGPQGLYAAMCHEPKPMTFPDQWRIWEVSFKPWAACRHAHPAIDCALELRAAGRLSPPFHVETYADAIAFCDRPNPVTETDAKFSLQHAVALIADGRDAGPEDFTPEAIAALASLRAQVTVAEDAGITARYPAHFGARVNGLELVDCRGDPERPLSHEGLLAKVHGLFKWGGLSWADANRAISLALEGEDAGELVAALEGWLS
jgi:2-methylcitrate dehydratase PrpD